MSKTCKDCMYCSIEGAGKVYCSGMPWHYPFGGSDTVTLDKEACEHFLERDEPTLFDDITASPEVLAEKLVYCLNSSSFKVIDSAGRLSACENEVWGSTILPGSFWTKYEEAVDATVAKLKEVTKMRCNKKNQTPLEKNKVSNLEPCPFCSDKNIAIGSDGNGGQYIDCGRKHFVHFIDCDKEAAINRWNTRPAETVLNAENSNLKNKLARVKEHLVIHRDSALNNIREDKDQCRKVQNEFLAWFCNRLIELINTDTDKGGRGLEEKAVFQTEEKGKVE